LRVVYCRTRSRPDSGQGGRPKKVSTKITDLGRINRHIIPLLGKKRVTHVTKADVTAMMKDIMAGKTNTSEKTEKLRGKSIVRGGLGAASRTVGLLGGIFTYARDELGIIEANPAHGVRKPKDAVRKRRLNEDEYRTLGRILAKAARMSDIHARSRSSVCWPCPAAAAARSSRSRRRRSTSQEAPSGSRTRRKASPFAR
jgi:hypothetical protein